MPVSGTSEKVGSQAIKMLIKYAFDVVFISPLAFANDFGNGDSSCLRTFAISTVRPAMTTLSRDCSNFLSALIVFTTFCVVYTLALYRSAKVFELCFFVA